MDKTSIMILSLSILLVMSSFVGLSFALESKGTKIPAINSDKICGDVFCFGPMTIQEKIQTYLQSLEQKYFTDSEVFQQEFSQIAKSVLKASTPTNLVEKSLPPIKANVKLLDKPTTSQEIERVPQVSRQIAEEEIKMIPAEREPEIILEAVEKFPERVQDEMEIEIPASQSSPEPESSEMEIEIPASQSSPEPEPSEIVELPDPEIGIITLNDENDEPEFQESLIGLEGEYHLNSAQGAVLEFPIVAYDYVLDDWIFDVDCGFSGGSMIFTTEDKELTCTYTDLDERTVTETASIEIIHNGPKVGTIYSNSTGSILFKPDLSLLSGEYPLNFDVSESDLGLLAYDYVLKDFSDNVVCQNINDVFSSDGIKELSCSYTDIAETTTTQTAQITITHPKPEIGYIFYDPSIDDYSFKDTLQDLESEYSQNSENGAYIPIEIAAIDYIQNDYVFDVNCNMPNDQIFPKGRTKLSCTYDDEGGQSDSESAIISVIETPKPVIGIDFEGEFYPINALSSEYETYDPLGIEFDLPQIQAADYALGAFTTQGISCSGLPSNNYFEVGRSEVNCTFTDSIGQKVSDSIVMTIYLIEQETEENFESIDETPEQTLWIFVPDNTSLTAENQEGLYLEFDAIAIDEIEGEVLAECDPTSGTIFPVGEHVVTCTALNSAGAFVQDFFVLTIESPIDGIPEWIKTNAEWWADNQIDDQTFASGIQFFIKEGIIVIPPIDDVSSEKSSEIPDWVKNNAKWWATGEIPDSSFIDGLQYLISNGIIKVN